MKKLITYLYKRYIGFPYIPRFKDQQFKGSITLYLDKQDMLTQVQINPAWGISTDGKRFNNPRCLILDMQKEGYTLSVTKDIWYNTIWDMEKLLAERDKNKVDYANNQTENSI